MKKATTSDRRSETVNRSDWSRDWFDLFAICHLALLWWLWLEASRMPEHVMKNQQVSEQK